MVLCGVLGVDILKTLCFDLPLWFGDDFMRFLLEECEVMTAFVSDLDSVVLHPLRHLLHLYVVIVHCLVAALICVLDC